VAKMKVPLEMELQLREPVLHENGISGKEGSLSPAHGGERCILMKLEGVLERYLMSSRSNEETISRATKFK
jgi:hypothetical protein